MENQKSKFKFIDLFAGIGGFHIAMRKYKGECVFISEIDDKARETYLHNFNKTALPLLQNGNFNEDITDEKLDYNNIPDFDILCAGFPCQAFSIAGKREGFNDTRGTLFFNIEKIIDAKRPKVIFLENVKNLQSHDKGKTFSIMKEILEEKLDYKIYVKVLNSMEYGNIPQNRERIYIIGFDPLQVRDYSNFKFPERIKLTLSINDIIKKGKQKESYYYFREHQYYEELSRQMKSRKTLYQWRRVYVRENKSNVCPTLTANMGTGGHNVPLLIDDYGIRKLTPEECLRFQGFPTSFNFPDKMANSHKYKQAGNSVVIPVIENITKNILKIIL